jgi:hypothetical protein
MDIMASKMLLVKIQSHATVYSLCSYMYTNIIPKLLIQSNEALVACIDMFYVEICEHCKQWHINEFLTNDIILAIISILLHL